MTIINVTPVVNPTSPLNVVVGLSATGASVVSGLQIRIGLAASAITSRDNLKEIVSDASRTADDYPREVVNQPLPAGAVLSGPSPVPFAVGPLDLSGSVFGSGTKVIPMRIGVSGVIDGERMTVAFVHTFLVWAPTTVSNQTPVSVVLPLADRPRLRPDGLLTDDELARQIEPGGRLHQLLQAVLPAVGGPPPTVALALDPVLLEALRTMARGLYTVATPGGPVDHGKDSNAELFLAELRDFARAGGTMFALPYGDADIAALVAAGSLHTALVSVLTGRSVVAAVLGEDVPLDTTIFYPAGAVVDPGAGGILRDPNFGFQTLVLDDRVVRAQSDLNYTPAAAVDVTTPTGPMRLLAADHNLAEAVISVPAGQAVAQQAVLAELAVVTLERPGQSRPQLIALPHDWNPPTGWASTVLRLLGGATPVSVPVALVTDPADAPATRVVADYPDWARQSQLPVSYIDGIDDIWLRVHRLAAVQCGDVPFDSEAWRTCRNQAVDAHQRALLRAASVFWRSDRGPGELIGQQVLSELTQFSDGIRVVASHIVTLTSSSGRVPVTVENSTSETVSVVLALSSTDPARLRSATRVERTIPPSQKIQVEIDVNAESAGTFPVDIRLLTPAGEPLTDGPALRVLVRSSAYGVIAIAITVGAVAVLLLAILVRALRRLRSKGRPSDDSSDGPTQNMADQDTPRQPAASQPGFRPTPWISQ